jgi:dipeptidyl-peptidase-4
MSLRCILDSPGLFKVGIAVAPVTDWRFYDTIYTERFMRKPSENQSGYHNASVFDQTEKLKGKLLLMHGLADDNVHFQHSAELIKELVKENKKFDLMVYPDNNHHMQRGNSRFHLY